MAQSTGIMLAAGAISFGNEWLQTGTPNFRIPIATMVSALFLNGIEKIYPKAAVGLGVIVMITVLVTPLHGKSPMQTAVDVLPKTK
jgi:hypothetical protein